MHKSPTMLGVAALGALMALSTVGCKEPEIKAGRTKARTVKASIAEFDPNADVSFDFADGGGGGERPDEYMLQQSFNAAFGGMDQCVVAAKERRGMKADAVLQGDVDLAVQLAPTGKAMAVNATLPNKHAKDTVLKDCIREAVAGVSFPSYDGPPVVAEFSCELDAGYLADEEDEDW